MEKRTIPDNFGEFITLRDHTGAPIELGSGGFGTTIRVNRPRAIGGRDFGRDYALKILHGQAIQDRKRREQFLSEIKALGALDHGNIVKYEDCGEQDGLVYLVMQLCSGGDLERFVRDFGSFSERTALQVTLQVCDGLREAHRKNYLHRDIKPRNILLVESVPPTADLQWFEEGIDEGKLCFKLVDFGLAGRLDHEVKTTGFAGSPMFCSPEQVRERELDARSDIYSLGMTLWYLVQGRGPLLRADGRPIADSREAMSAHTSPAAHDDRFPADLTPEVRSVLSRMLRKSPDQRFNSINEVSQAIRRVLESEALQRSAAPVALPDAEPEEVPLYEQPDYGKGDPADLYPHREERGRRSLGKFYRAIPRDSGEVVGLTAWDSLASPDAPQERELAQKLQLIKRVTCSPDAPPSLTAIGDVRRTASSWCIAEEWHEGVPLSELVACRGRSLKLEEIAQVLMPVAEAADFLLAHDIDNAMLTLGDIRLCGAGISLEDRSWLTLPVDRWGDWHIQLSALAIPADLTSTVESSAPASATISSSLSVDLDSTLSIGKAFCRLFYRMAEGSEVAAAADWDEYSYTEANRLSAGSNVLLRRAICGAEMPKSVSELLRKICANEGVYRLPNATMTTGVRRSSVRTSGMRGGDSRVVEEEAGSAMVSQVLPPEPAAPPAAPEPLAPAMPPPAPPSEPNLDALPETPTVLSLEDDGIGEETIAFQTDPGLLRNGGASLAGSPSDSIDMTQQRSVPIVGPSVSLDLEVAQIVEGAAGRVRSPYGARHIQEVSGPAWRANGKIYCSETNRPFRLPRNLPPLEAQLIPGRFDIVRSPYWDPPVEFPVPPGRWVAGGEVTCEQTGLPLRLPLSLPLPEGLVAPGRPGLVRSPYGDQPEITLPANEWVPGQKCVCTATGQFFLLPGTLPPLHAVPSETPGVFTSPYAPDQRIVLPPSECLAGARCECPVTGKPLVIPANFPTSWRFEGRVRQTQVPEAQSPFVGASESQHWQPVPAEQWLPGAVLRCARTQREFTLPMSLPTLPVSPAPNAPAVFSPFPPHQAVPIGIESWKPGAVFDLALPHGPCRVCLPEGELLPVTARPADLPGHFVSPYAPGQSFELPASDCVRGKTVACPVSGEKLLLPTEFPETWTWSGQVRQAKVPEVRSPFVKEDERAWIPVPAADWAPAGKVRCRVTGREFLLPAELPALKVAEGPSAPSVLSPFPPHEPLPVPAGEWRRNAEITVTLPAGKPCRVQLPAEILPLGRAEIEDLASLPLGRDPEIRSRRGAIRSPHGRKPWVEVAPREWLAGMRIMCPATRRAFWLPAELPPLEARLGPRPGTVWSPYNDQAVEVPADRWIAGDTVDCPATHGQFVLPAELPMLLGAVDEERPGMVESPFAPGEWFRIPPSQWQPSAEIVCPKSRRAFALPATLPEYIAEVELESPLGMVRSPYNERNAFRVRGEEWIPGGLVQCTATGQRARLPLELPPFVAALVPDRPGFILSPYVAQPTPRKVLARAWREGGIIECPETGRPLQLPSPLPELSGGGRGMLILWGSLAAVAIAAAVIWLGLGGKKDAELLADAGTPTPVVTPVPEATPPVVPVRTPVVVATPPVAPPPTPTPPVMVRKWPSHVIIAVSPVPDEFAIVADGGPPIKVPGGEKEGQIEVDLTAALANPAVAKASSLRVVLKKDRHVPKTLDLAQTTLDVATVSGGFLQKQTGEVQVIGGPHPFYSHLKTKQGDQDAEVHALDRPIKLAAGTYKASLVGGGRGVEVGERPLGDLVVTGTTAPEVRIPAIETPSITAGYTKTMWVQTSKVFRTVGKTPKEPPGSQVNIEWTSWTPVVVAFDPSYTKGTLYEVNNLVGQQLAGGFNAFIEPDAKNTAQVATQGEKFLVAMDFPKGGTVDAAEKAARDLGESAAALYALAPPKNVSASFKRLFPIFEKLLESTKRPSWKRFMGACLEKAPVDLADLDDLSKPVAGAHYSYLMKSPFTVQKYANTGAMEISANRHTLLDQDPETDARRSFQFTMERAESLGPQYEWKITGKFNGDPCLIQLRNASEKP